MADWWGMVTELDSLLGMMLDKVMELEKPSDRVWDKVLDKVTESEKPSDTVTDEVLENAWDRAWDKA